MNCNCKCKNCEKEFESKTDDSFCITCKRAFEKGQSSAIIIMGFLLVANGILMFALGRL